MKTITLYKKYREGNYWYSIHKWCDDTNFTELVSEEKFELPEGFELSGDAMGIKHIYNGKYDAELLTDKKGKPYLIGSPNNGWKNVYLTKVK